jgi:hypothetical protein
MKYILILLIVSFFYSQNANAFCESVDTQIILEADAGTVEYRTDLSKNEFLKLHGGKVSPNTLGLTVVQLEAKSIADPFLEQKGRKACVGVRKISVKIGYDTLRVYIDKKYRKGTCEYKVIKDHEDYHVRVGKEAVYFFRPDVEKALKKAVRRLKPIVVHSQAEVQPAFEKQVNQIMSEIQPVINHMNAKIAEKNYQIDTPESYRKTTALCSHW